MKKKLIVIASAVVLLVVGGIAGYKCWYNHWYQNAHVFVESSVYPKDSQLIDLRGTGVSLEHYLTLREQMPDTCRIRYDLPFQGGYFSDDTTELTLTSLTDEEVELLDYLPQLHTVNAAGCRDYAQLLALAERRPDCTVSYTVPILGREYENTTAELSFAEEQPDHRELMEALRWLPEMKSIYFDQPQVAAADLLQLCESWPEIAVTWQKDALGAVYDSGITELDLSGRKDLALEQVAAELEYFPNLEKVVMRNCGFDNETMAAFREQQRSQYKVVWSVWIHGLEVRTDDTYFMPVKYSVKVRNYQVQQLIYCEDMICVDLGHMPITDLTWVTGMPHLQYLIVADGPLLYIEPLSTCKELIYLELFDTPISDFTPLLGCTALQDLNVAKTNGDVMIFAQMPWLKNLWINRNGVTQAEHDALQAALPNTTIESKHGWITGNGWRQLENYFRMRDILGMPYNAW